MEMDPNDRDYTNGEITVHWKPSKCIHATTCYRELIEVFNPRKRPWVNMKGAPTENIIRIVKKCPIGVKGNFTLTGKDGEKIESGKVVYLCRCGGSKKKPFCDGSHRKLEMND